MVTSGLQIFVAFPSFGAKIRSAISSTTLPSALRLGDWLGGALQWHFTFMWVFGGGGLCYVLLQVISGHYRAVLFTHRDISASGNGSALSVVHARA